MKKLFSVGALGLLLFSSNQVIAQQKELRHLNADPFVGQLKHKPQDREEAISQMSLALRLLDYPVLVQELLAQKVRCGGVRYFIRQGDFIPAMLAGKNKILRDRIVNWQNYKAPLPSTWYEVLYQGKTYVLVVPWVCYNWTRGDADGVVKMRQPNPRKKKVDLSYVQYEGEEKTADYEMLPKVAVGNNGIVSSFQNAATKHMETWWEHHLDAGIYAAQSELARWAGAWVDTISWLKTTDPEVGIGFFATLNMGEVRISDYSWTEIMLAVQLGVQKTWADWETNHISQLQLKLRPGFFWQEGSSVSYGKHQTEIGLGGRLEYSQELSTKVTGYLVAEGFLDIANVNFSSTAERWGDSPERRSWLNVGFEINHYINSSWDFRWGAGVSYTWWDELTGLTGFAKFRYNPEGYNGIWNFGVNGMYPLALGLLKGVYAASEIANLGIFMSWESGELFLQKPDQKKRINNVSQLPNPYQR